MYNENYDVLTPYMEQDYLTSGMSLGDMDRMRLRNRLPLGGYNYTLPSPIAPVPAMDGDGLSANPTDGTVQPVAPVVPAAPSLIAPAGTVSPTVAPVAVTTADAGFTEKQRYMRAMARVKAEQYFTQRGLNPADYASQINQQLDNISNTFTETSDPTGAFDGNIGDTVYQGETTRRRNELQSQAEETFGTNYGQKAIGSSLLDDTINEILGTQRGEANQYLDRGKARGMFNEVGESAGRNAINTAEGAARARLNSTGQDIIQKYRGEANQVRDRAYGAASGYTLGRNFSLDPYISEAAEVGNRARTMGGGELRNTIGNTNFFDLQGVTNRAGAAQGAINLLDTDVATALNERKRLGGMGRGLGSQGAF